jgi:glycopeptide antibiotics resistance protein
VRQRNWLLLDVGLKVLVVGLTALGAFGGLERFEEKGFGWRLLAYPAVIVVLPVAWHLFGRGRRYPYGADVLITLPFLVDVLGNVLNLYDTISWWDDANHFINWFLLSAGFGALLVRARLAPLVTGALIVGTGCVTALLWELGEYVTFIRTNEDEHATAYTDTLGDMTLGTLGSLVAAVAVVLWMRRASERREPKRAAAVGQPV